MRRILLILCGLFAIPASGQLADTPRSVAVSGAGTDSCSAWVSDRGSTSAQAQAANQTRAEWLNGFLSGVNLFADSSGHLKGGVDDPKGVVAWIDKYCAARPTDPLFVAAASLVMDLRNFPRQ